MHNTMKNGSRLGLLMTVAVLATQAVGGDKAFSADAIDCLINPSVQGLVSCLPPAGNQDSDYRWEMGDGAHYQTSSGQPHIYHTYGEPGEYTVTLTVIRNGRETSSQSVLTIPESKMDDSAPGQLANL